MDKQQLICVGKYQWHERIHISKGVILAVLIVIFIVGKISLWVYDCRTKQALQNAQEERALHDPEYAERMEQARKLKPFLNND